MRKKEGKGEEGGKREVGREGKNEVGMHCERSKNGGDGKQKEDVGTV